MTLSPLAIIDVETTGTSPTRSRIIEVGILRIERGKVVDTFETLVNPESHIPPEITMLTGIHAKELEDAPTFSSIRNRVRDLLSDALFVAHNARFDYSFIKSEFARCEESFSSKLLCTAKLSRTLFPRYRRHNLDSIIERYGIVCEARHRALGDAKVLWNFLNHVQHIVTPKKWDSAVSFVSKTANLPAAITRKMIDDIPETSGVYTFYNYDGVPLYIGKSVNLKDRVLSHFSDATRNQKEAKVFQGIASIDYIQTDGELGALLTESRMIKKYKPLYNRQLREIEYFTVVRRITDEHGYFSIEFARSDVIDPSNTNDMLAIFRSLGQAKKYLMDLAIENKLCKKLLLLEKTKGACFGSQLKTCSGACMQKELPIKYNLRFVAAFSKTRIKQWPFDGPIAIYEGKTAHVISHWCYMGTRDEWDEMSVRDDYQFDYDTYKILSRYLLSNANKIHVMQMDKNDMLQKL